MAFLRNLTKGYGFKVFTLVLLILLLLIPVNMIRNIIYERRDRASDAEASIMEAWGARFMVMGPVLRIPCVEYEEIKTRDKNGAEQTEIREHPFILWMAPEDLNTEVQLRTETKKRGIFSVPLFTGTLAIRGNFDLSRIEQELAHNQTAVRDKTELVISLSGQKGIRGIEQARWNGDEIHFMPGNRGFSVSSSGGGIYGSVNPGEAQNARFALTMNIQGGKSLRMAPVGENSKLLVRADWPAPSFQGAYLPYEHSINDQGFEARWQASYLSRNIPLSWTDFGKTTHDFSSSLFGVNFFKALDHYDLNIRAVKHAVLFLIIPFLALFLLEIFLRVRIHPVQYLLAGIGNIVFYLLLLSLSEHLSFPMAYWISAPAVSLMMLLYSRSLLASGKRSWFIGLVMGLCYIFLYFTLQSEDWALLIGSIGAFAVTAVVMFLTRRLDWYGQSRIKADTPELPDEEGDSCNELS
ncbi:cell envelope integrity protein CreD [Treponema sp. OttesenSCG-928-L16]|nr:cell envelope integrity protein CreD [Treponema sp. OttesenSCG-928-L16]